MKRYAFLVLGLLATALAFLGVFIPGLPTTPFLIIALYAFARSSERLRAWLVRVPVFRSALEHAKNFEEHRAVTRSVKLVSQGFAWGSVFLLLFIYGKGSVAVWVVFTVALLCSITMYFIPTLKQSKKTRF